MMQQTAPEYCDLVMKGGITSGLVYPHAALELKERYRFKSIGGTSAGAIAAAACAAAALGERRKSLSPGALAGERPGEAGFDGLKSTADWLGKRGAIRSLFQPSPSTRAALDLVVSATGESGPGKIAAILLAILRVGGIAFVVVLALLLALGYWLAGTAGLIAAGPGALIGAVLAATVVAALRVANAVRRNQMGICTGLGSDSRSGERQSALTEWLHERIQNLAGQPPDEPLLFEHLWNAERYEGEPPGPRALTLRMITTSLSHHEPRSLPLDHGRFWFLKEEFGALFPASVVEWMIAQDEEPITVDGKTYYELPRAGRLPVIVATRMSLSFPLLLSAVPLHEPDFRAARNGTAAPGGREGQSSGSALDSTDALAVGGARDDFGATDRQRVSFRVCWFSDGGIASNFPIHLFDAPLPRWPTFAIDLVYPKTVDAAREGVFLPKENNQGRQRRYQSIANPSALKEVGAFLFAIISTMQNWRDLMLSRAPGQRDRIVRVSLSPTEGGMNLDMPEDVLSSVADKGAGAGAMLRNEFDFGNHWWVRWRNLASTSERFLEAFAVGATPPPVSDSYADVYDSATTGSPPPPSYGFTEAQQQIAQARFAAMLKDGAGVAAAEVSLSKGAPRPQPRAAIVPIY